MFDFKNPNAKQLWAGVQRKPSYEYAYVLVGVLGLPVYSHGVNSVEVTFRDLPELIEDTKFKDSLYCMTRLFKTHLTDSIQLVTAPDRQSLITSHADLIKKAIYDGNRIYMEHEMGFEINTILDWIQDCPRSSTVIEIRGARK